MATNYGAWDAATSGAGSGQQSLELLQGILASRRAAKQHQDEMERQAKIDARGEANIPGSSIFKGAPVGFNLTQAQAASALQGERDKRTTDQMARRYELKQQELSAPEAERITAGEIADATFQQLAKLYDTNKTSAAKGLAVDVLSSIPVLGTSAYGQQLAEKENEYKRLLRIAIQNRGKFISGTAMSDKEREDVAKGFPALGSSPEQFNQAVENYYREARAAGDAIAKRREIAGYPEVGAGIRSRLPKWQAPRVGVPAAKGSSPPPAGGAVPQAGSAADRLARLRASRQGK